jgi:uncharacterized protein (TIGR02996 family)
MQCEATVNRETQHDAAFLEAIADNPDDDTPRLVYADWLDDHGDAHRAEFIRVQCELARLPAEDPRRTDLGVAGPCRTPAAAAAAQRHHRPRGTGPGAVAVPALPDDPAPRGQPA